MDKYVYKDGFLLFSGDWYRVEDDGTMILVDSSVVPKEQRTVDMGGRILSKLVVISVFIAIAVWAT